MDGTVDPDNVMKFFDARGPSQFIRPCVNYLYIIIYTK